MWLYVHMWIYVHIWIYDICTYMYICAYMDICAYRNIYIYIYIYMHPWIYVHIWSVRAPVRAVSFFTKSNWVMPRQVRATISFYEVKLSCARMGVSYYLLLRSQVGRGPLTCLQSQVGLWQYGCELLSLFATSG